MAKKLEIQTCQFVASTDVIPSHLMETVAEQINGVFSWGDNNRSLVLARDIANNIDAESMSDDGVERRQLNALVKKLLKLDDMYIDLEN